MSDVAPARRRLSPRVAIGAGALVCALLVAAYWTLLRSDFAVLSTGLKPSEAAAIIVELDAKGVPHRLRNDGTTVLVPTAQVDDLRLAIGGTDLPLKGAVGFELFNKSDMGLTDFAQKINYQRALQGELARTIMMIDGIETARVHLALPERSLFRQGEARAKAAIEVIVAPGRTLAPERVDGIRQLVAAAVPELPASEVVVLDGDGRLVSGGLADPNGAAPVVDERTAAQNYYAARARAALAQQLPGQQVLVRALAMPRDGEVAAKRDFALRMTVITAAPLGSDEQRLAHDAVIAAAGLDESAGDTLVFEVGPTSVAPAPSAASTAVARSPLSAPAVSDERPQVGRWLILAAVLGLLIAIAAVLRRRRAAVLGGEHAFAARLRTLRATGAADA